MKQKKRKPVFKPLKMYRTRDFMRGNIHRISQCLCRVARTKQEMIKLYVEFQKIFHKKIFTSPIPTSYVPKIIKPLGECTLNELFILRKKTYCNKICKKCAFLNILGDCILFTTQNFTKEQLEIEIDLSKELKKGK